MPWIVRSVEGGLLLRFRAGALVDVVAVHTVEVTVVLVVRVVVVLHRSVPAIGPVHVAVILVLSAGRLFLVGHTLLLRGLFDGSMEFWGLFLTLPARISGATVGRR